MRRELMCVSWPESSAKFPLPLGGLGRGSTANYLKVIKLIFSWWLYASRPHPCPSPSGRGNLSFAASCFDLGFEFNRQFLHSRFAHRLDAAPRPVPAAPVG